MQFPLAQRTMLDFAQFVDSQVLQSGLARTYSSLDLRDMDPILYSPQTQLFAVGSKNK